MSDFGVCEKCGKAWEYTYHPHGDMLTCINCDIGWDVYEVILELREKVQQLEAEGGKQP